MNKYQYIKQNKDKLNDLICKGFISINLSIHLQIYEYYIKCKGSKMDKYTITAEEFKISDRTVRNIVKDFEGGL